MEMSFEVTDERIRLFAEATGDTNPLHLDEEFAARSPFKKRVAHGVLLSGIVSGLLGTKKPGLGTIGREMYSKFMRPVFIGDNLTVKAEIEDLNPKLKTCKITFVVTNQINKVVGKGHAVVIPPQTGDAGTTPT